MCLLICLLTLFCAVSGRADSSSLPEAIPQDWSVSLTLNAKEVIAGGIEDDAHRCGFEVQVRDAAGKARSNVLVRLPEVLWPGFKVGYAPPLGMSGSLAKAPILRWNPEMRSTPTGAAFTDASGKARGELLSGNVLSTILLRCVDDKNATRVKLEQVWSSKPGSQKVTDQLDGWVTVQFEPKAKIGGDWVAISGHHMFLVPILVSLQVWEPTLGKDVDGDGKPDGLIVLVKCDGADPMNSDWQAFLKMATFDPMFEISPGVYRGRYRCDVPDPDGQSAHLKHILTAGIEKFTTSDKDVVVPVLGDEMPTP